MKERLRQLRNELNLSQTAFGERIGLGLGAIKNLEYGKTELDQFHFDLICSTYNVNPIWLSSGEGDMFIEDMSESRLAQLQRDEHLTDIDIQILRTYLTASPSQRKIIADTISALFNSMNSSQSQ